MEEKHNTHEQEHLNDTPPDRKRRRLLGALVAGGGAAVLLPEKWIKPVAEKIVTPAHAQATVPSKDGSEEIGGGQIGGTGQIGGGGTSPGGSGGNTGNASDRRLKENIARVGRDDRTGLSLYEFSYIGAPGVRYRGVMADEVEPVFPDAVITRPDGMKAVKYDVLGIEFSEVDSVAA